MERGGEPGGASVGPAPIADARFASDASLWVPEYEMAPDSAELAPLAFWIVDAHRPHVAVQIGVGRGDTYACLCQAVDRLGLSTRCFGVDTFASGEHSGFYGPELLSTLRAHHDPRYGSFSDLVPGVASDVADTFDDRSVDLLVIDDLAPHDALVSTFSAWESKLSPRAVVVVYNTSLRGADPGSWGLWTDLVAEHGGFELPLGRGLGVVAIGAEVGDGVAALCALPSESDGAATVRRFYERLGSSLAVVADQRRVQDLIDDVEAAHAAEIRDLEVSAETESRRLAAIVDRLEAEAVVRERSADEMHGELRRLIDDQADRSERVVADLVTEAASHAATEERRKQEAAALSGDLEASRVRITRMSEEAKAAAEKQKQLLARATRAERRYDRLRNRRIVRLSLRVAEAFRPLFRFVRGQTKPRSRVEDGAPAARPTRRLDPRTTIRDMRALRTDPGPGSGPHVTIVTLTRNGSEHLERMLTGLRDRTAYRSFDLIVVDNASTDDTAQVLARDWGFPISVIVNDRNRSFSHGCNQGLAEASGEYVLLLNNDTDPISAGWLGSMVAAMEADVDIGAAGALLVYPEATTANDEDLALTVQHRGIAFRSRMGTTVGYNLGGGEDPTAADLAETVEVPGVTAACMLIRRDELAALGGLDEAYVYGFEDVDLNLRLRETGRRIVMVGAAALFHHEFGTQASQSAQRRRSYRAANIQHFAETWAARLGRTVGRDLGSTSVPSWRGRRTRMVAITLTADDPTKGWGDWYTAHELGDAFAAAGWEVHYAEAYKDRWLELPDDVDLIIGLLDRYDARTAPAGAVTVAWIRNWTDRWLEQPWIHAYDVLLPSSEISAEMLRSRGLGVTGVLPLATNPARFHPTGPDAVYESDYTFTGNHWGANRKLLNLLDVAPGERFSIYGKGWGEVGRASRYWRGHADYDDLPLIYNSASIVLDDTAGPTLPYGAINSRVFDALASGTLVLTDNVVGSDEVFDGELPAYRDRAELRRLLDTYLADHELRAETARRLRQRVIEQHTYERRVEQILAAVGDRIDTPRVAIKIGCPSHEVAEQWGDTHFARAFASELERAGWATSIDILPEWDELQAQDVDVAVHLRGLMPYVPKPGQVNVLWIISHPEDVTDAECERYDLVLVASTRHAAELADRLSVPVVPFLQASAFVADGAEGPAETEGAEAPTDVVFVGNSRGVMRHAVQWSVDRGVSLSVYGSGWEDRIPEALVVDEYVPNDRLAATYRDAAIVLNDHWPGMAAAGFISNRVFDVLAAGGFVLSDPVAGLEDVFGDTVPIYRDAEELERLVERYREHADERAELAARGRAIVVEEHSFARRARQFIDLVTPYLLDRRPTVVGTRWADTGTGIRSMPDAQPDAERRDLA